LDVLGISIKVHICLFPEHLGKQAGIQNAERITRMAKKKIAKKAPAKKTVKAAKKTVKAAAPRKKTAAAKTAKKPAAKKTAVKKAVVKKTAGKSAPAAKTKARTNNQTDEGWILTQQVVAGILEKKGQNIKVLDLRNIENAVCDYFIICEGNSNTQVDAIADSVEGTVKKNLNQRPYRSEGWENALWILIDYVNVVVHVFEKETRYFYNLESLWADAVEIPVKQ
jgi:ribosome-associated protein